MVQILINEALPVLGVGHKRFLKVSTYVELHPYLMEIVKLLEEIFEMGILKGTAKKVTDREGVLRGGAGLQTDTMGRDKDCLI